MWLLSQTVGHTRRPVQADILWSWEWCECYWGESFSLFLSTHNFNLSVFFLVFFISNTSLFLHSSSPMEMLWSLAQTTHPAGCMISAAIRSWLLTRTRASWAESPPSHPHFPDASSWLAMTTSPATSGTCWRMREWVSKGDMKKGAEEGRQRLRCFPGLCGRNHSFANRFLKCPSFE